MVRSSPKSRAIEMPCTRPPSSPDGRLLATGGYHKRIMLWSLAGERLHEFTQHNGAIYDLAFSPDGLVLASASADETVKLWHVERGVRLDTLGQPEGEQYAVLFSPDGKFVVAGGRTIAFAAGGCFQGTAPESIRSSPRATPMKAADGARLGAGRRDADLRGGRSHDQDLGFRSLIETKLYPRQADVVSALAGLPDDEQFLASRADGPNRRLPPAGTSRQAGCNGNVNRPAGAGGGYAAGRTGRAGTQRPAAAAQTVSVPAKISGVIHWDGDSDVGPVSFHGGRRRELLLETHAARRKSPLDSKLEVLDSAGRRIPRVMLQAVRDSYFTFRGKDSSQTGDFRVHNWEEMTLNQYLYAAGEVVRLHTYPRGPDSGFDVYPKFGKRHNYFGTTAVSHALVNRATSSSRIRRGGS